MYIIKLFGESIHMLSVNYKFVLEFIKKKQGVKCHAVLRDESGRDIGNVQPSFVMLSTGLNEITIDREVSIQCMSQCDQAVLFVYYTQLGLLLFFQKCHGGVDTSDFVNIPKRFKIEVTS